MRRPFAGAGRRSGFRGLGGSTGGGGPLTFTDLNPSGTTFEFAAADATALGWPDLTAAITLSPAGSVAKDADEWGARNGPRVQMTGGAYFTDAAALGQMLAGANPVGFTVGVAIQSGSVTANRHHFSWGAIAGGATSAYFALRTRATGPGVIWRKDAGTTTAVDPSTSGYDYALDNAERVYIIRYAGSGGALRIWCKNYSLPGSGWFLAYNATPANTGAMTTITRFCLGGLYQGSSTLNTPVNPGNWGGRAFISPNVWTDDQITQAQALYDSLLSDQTSYQLTTGRTQIINSATPTFPGSDGNNIMFGSIVKAASWHVAPLGDYYCLFGDHDGTYIRVAYADAVTGPWTVITAGTDITLAALNAAGGYSGGTHVSSPEIIVDDVGERYVVTLHGDSTGLGHESVAAESIDLENFTFLDSAARLSDGTGMLYVRPFTYGGEWYAVSDTLILFRSATLTGSNAYSRQTDPATFRGSNGGNGRHAGCVVRGDTLVVFWTNRGDYCERIKYASLDMSAAGWDSWAMGAGADMLFPYTVGDGADMPWTTSGSGAVTARVRELRDPGVFIDPSDGTHWLIYAQAGEDALGVLDITSWLDTNFPVP